MELKEIARQLQGTAANLALRMPISWVNILTRAPITVDVRTLDARTQWFLQLLVRSGQQPLHRLGVERARAEFDLFQPMMSGRPAPSRPRACAGVAARCAPAAGETIECGRRGCGRRP